MDVNSVLVTEEPGPNVDNKPTTNLRISFKVGTHGPFILRMPKEGFSSAAANVAIQNFVTELGLIGGMTPAV